MASAGLKQLLETLGSHWFPRQQEQARTRGVFSECSYAHRCDRRISTLPKRKHYGRRLEVR